MSLQLITLRDRETKAICVDVARQEIESSQMGGLIRCGEEALDQDNTRWLEGNQLCIRLVRQRGERVE